MAKREYNGHGTRLIKRIDSKSYVGLVVYNPNLKCTMSIHYKGSTYTAKCMFLNGSACINDAQCWRNNVKYIFLNYKTLKLTQFEHETRLKAKEAESKVKINNRFAKFTNYIISNDLELRKDIKAKEKEFKDKCDKLYSNIITLQMMMIPRPEYPITDIFTPIIKETVELLDNYSLDEIYNELYKRDGKT